MTARDGYQLDGDPFGNVYPPRNRAKLPSVDPRTIALSCLRAYVAGLTFYRPGALLNDGTYAEPIPFAIQKEQFHIEQPDNEQDVILPSLVAVSAEEEQYDSPGLTSQINEGSADKFGRGTALQVQYEQLEFFRLEAWAGSRAERRSLVAGLQTSLIPTEALYGLRLRMDAYYGETVCFTPWSLTRRDLDAVRNRRVGAMRIEMRFNVVALVNVERIKGPIYEVTAGPALPEDYEGGGGGECS